MSEAGCRGAADRFVSGGFEWGGKDGGEGYFGVEDQTGNAYPCETFNAVVEVNVSVVP